MAEAKRRLAAILSADVAGYSRLMGDDERATLETLDAYRVVFSDNIAKHDGRVVDTAGDSVLAVFDSVVEAVGCAAAVQKELTDRNAALAENRQMHFRIGVNLGDVIAKDDGTIYGDGVNVAARLESLAEPGEVTVSEAAYRQVEGKTDLGFQDIGEHEVKNIARPVRAYQVLTDGAPGAAPRPRQTQRTALIAAAAAVVVIIAGVAVWQTTKAPPEIVAEPVDPVLALPTGPTIAVLPFTNMSDDPEQEYFSDGLTEDIITGLTRFTKLSVIARNSTFAYKGKAVDIREIGSELGARYVLQGSVRRLADRVRITAQLIDAESGAHIWADRFDRELKDLFEVQDEITDQIVGRLDVEVDRVRLDQARRMSPRDFNAYDAVLRARKLIYEHSEVNHAKSRDLLEQAIALDDQFAHAYLELAWVYLDEYRFGWNARPNPLDRALEVAERAVELDPNNGFAHWRLAKILFFRKEISRFDFEKTRALELNPNHAETIADIGIHLVVLDRTDEAYEYAQRALQLDPNFPSWVYFVPAGHFYRKEQYQEALAATEQIKMPEFFWTHAWRAVIYAQLENHEKARAEAAEVLRLKPDFAVWDELEVWNAAESYIEHFADGAAKAGLPLHR